MFIEHEDEDPLKKYFKYTWKQTEIDNHVVEEIKNATEANLIIEGDVPEMQL